MISSAVETGSLGVLSKIVASTGNGQELIQVVPGNSSLTFRMISTCDTACRLRPDFVVTPQGIMDIPTNSIAFMNIMPTFFNEISFPESAQSLQNNTVAPLFFAG